MIRSLDTNILVDILRGKDQKLCACFLSRPPMEYAVSEIVRAELLHGAEMSREPVKNRKIIGDLLAPLSLISFSGDAAVLYGRIKADLQRRGVVIGANDLLIAASAMAHQHILVTRNTGEFARIPGLQTEEW